MFALAEFHLPVVARVRLIISTDSEPSPRAQLDAAGPDQSMFNYLVKFRRAPTTFDEIRSRSQLT